jgi:uncharacterized protein (TIGR03085 family)
MAGFASQGEEQGHGVGATDLEEIDTMIGMGRHARTERLALADALARAGPDAPTLCEGWTTKDLAAHLAARERRADAAPGIAVSAFGGWTEHVRRQYRDTHTHPELVDMVRHLSWWNPLRWAPLDEVTNLLEFFVHHEDVRRGGADWAPRDLDPGLADALWERLPTVAKLNLRKVRATVEIEAPGRGRFTAREGDPQAATAVVRGEPGELVLFFFGRQRACQVTIDAPAEIAARLQGAAYGV